MVDKEMATAFANPVTDQSTTKELHRSLSADIYADGAFDPTQNSFDVEANTQISRIGAKAKTSVDDFASKALRKQGKQFDTGMLQSSDVRSGRVFNEDSHSYSVYSTITSPKVKKKVIDLLKDMHTHAESQQHTMTDDMDYRDILTSGILYEGEFLVDGLDPMRLATLDMMKAEDAGFSSQKNENGERETRFGIRLYLTNQRLIVVDAEPDSGSRMREQEHTGKITKKEYKLSYEIESELWYYPIPLADVKGLSLDVRTVTKSQVALRVMRPWWSVVVSLIAVGMVSYGALRSAGIVGADKTIGYELMVGGYIIFGAMAVLFTSYNYLVQGKFEPWQLQERQLRLGITDPISQAPAIMFCNMAKDYTFMEATEFVRFLQMNTPQLHYGSLTQAFMRSKVNSPYDRTFLSNNKPTELEDAEDTFGELVDVKLVIESPVNRIMRLKLRTDLSLADATEQCTKKATIAGVLPLSTIIRLAIIDAEGDKCLVKSSGEMRAFLEGSKTGAVKLFAWPEFTSMPPPLA